MRHFLCLCCFSKTEFWGAKRHKKCSLSGALKTMQRGWDSNPRCSCPHTNFPGLLLQPLGHLSRKFWLQITAFFLSTENDSRNFLRQFAAQRGFKNGFKNGRINLLAQEVHKLGNGGFGGDVLARNHPNFFELGTGLVITHTHAST